MYVDDRYCIFDWDYNRSRKHIRHIEIRCINTKELIHERDFEAPCLIRGEYKGGIIVAETKNAGDERSIIVWDVHNNRITPIRDLTSCNQPMWISTAHIINEKYRMNM